MKSPVRFASALALLAFAATAETRAAAPSLIDPALSNEEIAALSAEAFYWGINIAGFYELRYVYTQLEGLPAYRGVNRMLAMHRLMDASVRYATTVNASTLYSGGAFDVSAEPVVVEAAKVTDGRYWSVQAADQNVSWFFMAGSQFTGNDAQRYLIVGPRWRGRLPPGFRSTGIVRATSDSFTLAVRVAVTTRDERDMAGARAVLDGVVAAPLSQWRAHGGRVPPIAEQPIVRGSYRSFPRMSQIMDIARSMTPIDYLQLLSLAINDPALTKRSDSRKEVETLGRLARIGLREGVIFDPERLGAAQRAALERGFQEARRRAKQAFEASLVDMNGWRLQSSLFYDDLDYVAKAGADDVAWGTPVPYQSHSIAYVFRDSEGRPLDSRNRYTLTLALDDLPPVTEFWELPVYDAQGYFIANPIDRYSVTSYLQKAGHYAERDGRIVFHLQAERPADPEQARNWLPTPPEGGFQLAARFYGPMAPLIDGSYAMPRIVRTRTPD